MSENLDACQVLEKSDRNALEVDDFKGVGYTNVIV